MGDVNAATCRKLFEDQFTLSTTVNDTSAVVDLSVSVRTYNLHVCSCGVNRSRVFYEPDLWLFQPTFMLDFIWRTFAKHYVGSEHCVGFNATENRFK